MGRGTSAHPNSAQAQLGAEFNSSFPCTIVQGPGGLAGCPQQGRRTGRRPMSSLRFLMLCLERGATHLAPGEALHCSGSEQGALRGPLTQRAGCRYQVPRKVPLRIEPKTFFGASQLCTELPPVLVW